jgi:hypothetical protein
VRVKARVLAAQNVALCAIRKWWRPLAHIGLIAAIWVNLVVIPWKKWEVLELEKAALFVTAIVAALGLRSLEKIKGAAD